MAAQVVAEYGGDLSRMRRALGMSNATWVGGGLAVRIANTPLVDDMAAEVALVRALPPEVGHPRILGAGTTEGHDWIVTEEVQGQNLHEAWSTLTPEERRGAIRQLWARVRAVHNATPSLRPLVGSHSGFVPTPDDATAAAARVSAALGLTAVQRSRLHEVIGAYYRAAPVVEQVVNHGDLALMNALWSGEVVALLDFEFAVLGPVEIDLCRLVSEAVVSEAGHGTDPVAGTFGWSLDTAVMSTLNEALLTVVPAIVTEPVTELVRPAATLLWPNRTSLTRYPPCEPAATFQVPSIDEPAAGPAAPAAVDDGVAAVVTLSGAAALPSMKWM